jgi:hypothetical protein
MVNNTSIARHQVARLPAVTVPCVSIEAQREFHVGYAPREIDFHDLAELGRLAD